MRVRKKQPEKTRRAILEAAAVEFSVHGYAGTGLGTIVARAGLTKGALFHHFSDKQSMAEAWIGELLSEEIQNLWIEPLSEIATLDELVRFLRMRCVDIRPGDATTTLVSHTAAANQIEGHLASALHLILKNWRDAVAVMLERGKIDGWIHRSIKPAAEAAFLVSLIAGLSVCCLAAHGDGAGRDGVDALEGYLETLRAQ